MTTFREFLAEMAQDDIPDVEKRLKEMFDELGLTLTITRHFQLRIANGAVGGNVRGEQIEKAALLGFFRKLTGAKAAELQGADEVSVLAIGRELSVAFVQKGKHVTLLTVMTTGARPPTPKPGQVVVKV